MAPGRAGSSNSIRFGSDFELDLQAYELRQAGQLLKLERIPTELLLLLIEQRGKVVGRDQIVDKIWGKDVFLDTDNSINAAIRKIRQVLKDDPEKPRFVQTITGRGYRFIAAVDESGSVPAHVEQAGAPASPGSILGKKVSHYRILQVLGGGGMGVVYKAEDLKLGRRVALKFLPSELSSDPKALERMQREARAASSLDHPNICAIYELGEHEGQPFIAMQLLEGETLREWIESASSAMSPARLTQIVTLATQIADGLDAAHQKGIVHRDIKPANIFITNRGEAKILDFGVAKVLEPETAEVDGIETGPPPAVSDVSLSQTGRSPGTPSYLSPEQVRGEKLDARSDLFSFGLVLYEMCTGRKTFAGNTATVIRNAVINTPAIPVRQFLPDVPVGLEKIIDKSLEKERSQRYQSAKEMQADLRRVSVVPAEVSAHGKNVWSWLAAVVALLAIALLALDVGGVRERLLRHDAAEPTLQIKTRPSVAVLGFRNLTGKNDEAWISTALSEMLVAELSAGQQLRVIPSEDVAKMKTDLQLPAVDNYGRDTLRQIRNYIGSDVVVLGSYLAAGKASGGKIRMDLQIQDAREGETIGVIQIDGAESALADLTSQGGAALRQKLGIANVSPSDARQISASVPTSTEAARLYAEGLTKLRNGEVIAARELLEKSVALDPKHALSHSALAQAWAALGYELKAQSEAKLALDLSADLPREQRLSIEGRSHEYAHDLRSAIEIYTTLRNFFPDDLDYALRLASAQTKAHLGKDALQTIARARQLPKPESDDTRLDLTEALAAESLADFAGEERAASEAARKAQQRGSRLQLASARQMAGWSWERRGDLDKATQGVQEALTLAQAVQNQQLQAGSLRLLGIIAYDRGDLEQARTCYKDSLAIFQKIGAMNRVGQSMVQVGNIDYEQEKLLDAKRWYEEALRIDREISAPPGQIGSDLGSIANALDGLGQLVEATTMQEASLKAFREGGDRRGEADDLLNLGNVLVERGELEQAKQNYDQGLTVAREIDYKTGIGSLLTSMTDILIAQDRLAEARATITRVIGIRKEVQEQVGLARAQVELAQVALAEGKFDEAERLTRQALPVFEERKQSGDAAGCEAFLARALLGESKLPEARAEAAKALSYAHQTVDRSANFLALLADGEVKLGDRNLREAAKPLETVMVEATRLGYRNFSFEARLDMAMITLQVGGPSAGRALLSGLRNESKSRGFNLIARKADGALGAKTKREHS